MSENRISSKKEVLKKIFLVAFPLVVQGLVFQLQSLTDKAFLGNLDTHYVSAAGAAQLPYGATVDSLMAMSMGCVIIVSMLVGANKKEKISAYVKSGCFYHSLLGIIAFLAWQFGARSILEFFQVQSEIIEDSIQYVKICSYYLLVFGVDSTLQAMLQGMGKTKPIMYAGLLKVGLNIIISWLLIFGMFGCPRLLVEGAAIGTLVANIFSFLFILGYCLVLHGKQYGFWTRKKEWFQIRPYLKSIALGIPVGMEYLLWNVSNLFLIRFINGFSYLDMAIYTLTFGFQCIVYMIFDGTSKAALTLMGQSLGAKNRPLANRYFNATIILNFMIVALAALCFFIFPEKLLDIFSNDIEVIRNGGLYLRWIGIIMFTQSMNVICGNAIRANGNTRWMLFSQIIGSFLVISISWVLIEKLHMNMLAIYVTLFIDETIRGGINYLYYRKKYYHEKPGQVEGLSTAS